MNYSKPPESISAQIAKLKTRGLTFGDEAFAERCLSSISYYRFRAYTYPFQDNLDSNHRFKSPISFEDIYELYLFDRKLRSLVFGALEQIEIAIRTQIIHQWSLSYGSHWQLNGSLFRYPAGHSSLMDSMRAEIDRSTETFIDHYKTKYTSPTAPPSWMSLEVSSFSLLPRIFQNLKKGPEKRAVTAYFGLSKVEILENWMLCFSQVRNICAHHGRLWNRRLTAHVLFPTHPKHQFIRNRQLLPYKLYAVLSCMQYMMRRIGVGDEFRDDLKTLASTCPLRQEKEMGFPKDWRSDPFWS